MDEEELIEELRRDVPASPPAATRAAPSSRDAVDEAPNVFGTGLKLGVVLLILGIGVVALLTGTDAFVYSKLVDEVMADPAAHHGRPLRVEGQLVSGSVERESEPCEHRFVIERGDHQMPVRFPRCVVPDTFQDNGMVLDVVVEGELQEDNVFLADQIIPRCPSKYEMRQRQQNGEAPPYAMPRGES